MTDKELSEILDNLRSLPAETEVVELLWKKLPDWMDDKQKKIKINNLLSELRKNTKIKNSGSDKKPIREVTNK